MSAMFDQAANDPDAAETAEWLDALETVIEREGPLAVSNVLLVCGRCDRPVRMGIKVLSDGRKVRVCKRCGESVDKG